MLLHFGIFVTPITHGETIEHGTAVNAHPLVVGVRLADVVIITVYRHIGHDRTFEPRHASSENGCRDMYTPLDKTCPGSGIATQRPDIFPSSGIFGLD